MKEQGRFVVAGLIAVLLVFWLGFLVHRAPRFAGTAWGGLLGSAGATLMLVPLGYLVVKRVSPLKRLLTGHVSMPTLLKWHIYAGIIGPILGLLHTGHKFVSPLGIALTAMMLIVVISGFIGRYLMTGFSESIREKRETLTQLEAAYRQTAGEMAAHGQQTAALGGVGGFRTTMLATLGLVLADGRPPSEQRGIRLAESIADLEYAIRAHEAFKRCFASWLKLHIVISLALYILLGLHVWAGVYFGLRWFS